MTTFTREQLVRASFLQAATNAVINGTIGYATLEKGKNHLITADSITAGSNTVVGHAMPTAIILAVVFTLMSYKSHRQFLPGRTWSEVAKLATKNAIYAFGLMIIAGVMWQKFFPNLSVTDVGAAAITGLIAGTISGITTYTTVSELLARESAVARAVEFSGA